MAIKIELTDNGRRIGFHCSGDLTGQEFVDIKLKLLADPELTKRLESALISLAEVNVFDIEADDVRALADIDRQLATLAPRVVVAVIAPRDHDFGIARMWEGIVDIAGWTTSVFRTREEGEVWLERQVASSRAR